MKIEEVTGIPGISVGYEREIYIGKKESGGFFPADIPAFLRKQNRSGVASIDVGPGRFTYETLRSLGEINGPASHDLSELYEVHSEIDRELEALLPYGWVIRHESKWNFPHGRPRLYTGDPRYNTANLAVQKLLRSPALLKKFGYSEYVCSRWGNKEIIPTYRAGMRAAFHVHLHWPNMPRSLNAKFLEIYNAFQQKMCALGLRDRHLSAWEWAEDLGLAPSCSLSSVAELRAEFTRGPILVKKRGGCYEVDLSRRPTESELVTDALTAGLRWPIVRYSPPVYEDGIKIKPLTIEVRIAPTTTLEQEHTFFVSHIAPVLDELYHKKTFAF